jgi:hypothetical protein
MLGQIDRFGMTARPQYGTKIVLSGSRREGFHLKGSDWDFMAWPFNHKLICTPDQASHYDSNFYTLILMENCSEQPGFVMLQLLSPSNDANVRQSCAIRKNKCYIKSSTYREKSLTRLNFHRIIHGPCATGKIGEYEFDSAYCFRSDFWPITADEFKTRCRQQGWPAPNVLDDIIGDGCHVVPIGQKGSSNEDSEWRMSFSAAELKLVHCMNHTQFMCYGLLKVFLKEALDIVDVKGQSLLCSYFMKTVLFWVIQSNKKFEWSPANLLSGFWMCFKGLLSNVRKGCLPNFFIPDNNMFRSKIFGHSQELLCSRLGELYDIGIACLLRCSSIRYFFLQTIFHKEAVISTEESDILPVSAAQFEIVKQSDMLREIVKCSCFTIRACFQFNRHFHQITPLMLMASPGQGLTFEVVTSDIVRSIANHLLKFPANNKLKLKLCRSCEALLRLRIHLGCLSESVYLAFFYCLTGENQKARTILETLMKDITRPGVIHNDEIFILAQNEMLGGQPFYDVMKKATMTIQIYNEDLIIKELEPEQREANRNILHIPPYILALMLLIVCNHCNLPKQQEVLHELYFLLNFNAERYVCSHLMDISWQILGICQQICGDHQGTILSYQKSLQQKPFHEIQKATHWRIQDARSKI